MAKKKRKKQATFPTVAVLFVMILCMAGWVYQSRVWEHVPAAGPATMPAATTAPTSLRIASWNIRQLGARSSTDIIKVAELIVREKFDVVAIQEIQRDGRVDALLNQLGHPWRGTSIGPASGSGERLGYIYRGDRVVEVKPATNLAGASGRIFERIPYTAGFRAGNFDFELVSVHLSWGNAAQRLGEMQTLADLVKSHAQEQAEKDIIVLGDFNEQKTRPNLSYMDSAGWKTVIKEPTNLSSREIYDHILLSPLHTREFGGNVGVVRFDERDFGDDDKSAAEAVSDHRPIWAEFTLDLGDDD